MSNQVPPTPDKFDDLHSMSKHGTRYIYKRRARSLNDSEFPRDVELDSDNVDPDDLTTDDNLIWDNPSRGDISR